MPALATESRGGRKRRQASPAGVVGRLLRGAAAAGAAVSAESDAGVEPAIQDIGNEVEEDDETGEHEGHGHHDRRVVGEHGRNQERADAGDAEDLLVAYGD